MRREPLSLRQAVRLGPGEAATVVVGLLLVVVSIVILLAAMGTTDRILDDADCVTAHVLGGGSYHRLKSSGSAHLSYAVGGRSYAGTLHYDGDRLQPGSSVEICVDVRDPAVFATDVGVTGTSGGIRGDVVLSAVLGSLGLVALVIFASNHQWRLEDGRLTPVVWRRSAKPRHGNRLWRRA